MQFPPPTDCGSSRSSFGIIKMNQKENLEYHAVINFIREYNRNHKRQFTFSALNKPPMPDAVCKLNKREIGIEVVHSYGTGIEAAMRLGNRQESNFPKKKHLERRITPVDIRALNSLNDRLFDKSKKEYSFSPVCLLIRNAFTLWGLKEYKRRKNEIYIPENHPFKQIWLLFDENSVGFPGVLRLA